MPICSRCGTENPGGFRFCGACASPLSPAPSLPRELRKTVTIVFCDVTGSTALGKELDPESLRRVMSSYFEAMRMVLERHGGTIEKFIGDAVMAVFGVPVLHEDDALRAVRAAVEMRAALAPLNDDLERERGVRIAVRIGVNTGEVVVGGSSQGQSFATGDAVNTAARLEQAASPDQILISEQSFRLVRDAVQVETVAPLAAKGKAAPLIAFRLLAVDPAAALGHKRHLEALMVGRQRQLALLRQAFANSVADRSCQLFSVLGAAGVGKSRLVKEFLLSLGDDAQVLTGRCLSYGEGISFWPLRRHSSRPHRSTTSAERAKRSKRDMSPTQSDRGLQACATRRLGSLSALLECPACSLSEEATHAQQAQRRDHCGPSSSRPWSPRVDDCERSNGAPRRIWSDQRR